MSTKMLILLMIDNINFKALTFNTSKKAEKTLDFLKNLISSP